MTRLEKTSFRSMFEKWMSLLKAVAVVFALHESIFVRELYLMLGECQVIIDCITEADLPR
jgi:hypothetical protein